MTTNHPAHGPVSLDRLHQISEILSKAAAQSDGGNLGYAMADAVKVIDSAIAAFGAEPVAWLHSDNGIGIPAITRSRNVADSWFSKGWNINPLYTTPPATVSFPNEVSWEDVSEEITEDDMELALAWAHGFNQCRAAMLQAGNSPVTPDGYVLVPKEMTPEMMRAVQIKSVLGGYAASELSGAYDIFREFWSVAVTSAPLYTAPSELVTQDGSTCKYCGGTGYFRWQKSAETFPCPCVGCDLPSAGGK